MKDNERTYSQQTIEDSIRCEHTFGMEVRTDAQEFVSFGITIEWGDERKPHHPHFVVSVWRTVIQIGWLWG